MIEVVDYDAAWPLQFEVLRALLRPALAGIDCVIEHVGSTSVPGLAAKPVIDLDIILADAADTAAAIEALSLIGYEHLGDLGIPGREAFRHPAPPLRHNLYCGPGDALPIRNHLAVRDALRSDAALRAEYSELKRALAARTNDIDVYVEGKSALILRVLAAAGLSADALAEVEQVNRADR